MQWMFSDLLVRSLNGFVLLSMLADTPGDLEKKIILMIVQCCRLSSQKIRSSQLFTTFYNFYNFYNFL